MFGAFVHELYNANLHYLEPPYPYDVFWWRFGERN